MRATPARGNDRAHGGANAHVHIRHGRDVLEHDGQARSVGQLLDGAVVHRHAVGPHLQRHAAGDVLMNVIGFHMKLHRKSAPIAGATSARSYVFNSIWQATLLLPRVAYRYEKCTWLRLMREP